MGSFLRRATKDDRFLERLLPSIEKVTFLLGAWEVNNRGLIYVPLMGDWAEEYLHHGYVLYDELLYLQAQCVLAVVHSELHGTVQNEPTPAPSAWGLHRTMVGETAWQQRPQHNSSNRTSSAENPASAMKSRSESIRR